MRQRATKWQQIGQKGWRLISPGCEKDEWAVKSRLLGAILRAGLVMAVIVMPAAVVVDVSADTRQMVTLAALILGAVTFFEYNATYPSVVEFRDAAPFNRLRFVMLACTVVLVTLCYPIAVPLGQGPNMLSAGAAHVGAAMDFPFSPARLALQLGKQGADPIMQDSLRNAAGLAYITNLAWLGLFGLAVRLGGWPSARKPLNVWVNLPMFDPSLGVDIVRRLHRDGRINIWVGFALPFMLPVLAKMYFTGGIDLDETPPHSLIWIVSLWAFFPASLILRGFALLRIAELIEQSRAKHSAVQAKSFAPA
jgi:hypothetical protein